MSGPVIVDTGPIVALLSRRDRHHAWAAAAWASVKAPLLTCEAVLAEVCFLLGDQRAAALTFVGRGAIELSFSLGAEHERVAATMTRYAGVPMALADACLVRMSELHATSTVMTLDSDFRVYRRHGRQVIPLIIPPSKAR